MNESRTAELSGRNDSATTAASGDRPSGRRAADRIVGSSEAIQRASEQAAVAARSTKPVCIVGEPGVGKSHFARAIHAWSRRATGPFVVFPASATAASGQAEELFGTSGKPGALARAADGTLLVKGAGQLADGVRTKLTRAIEEGRFHPEGGAEAVEMRARVIVTAANEDEAPQAWLTVSIPPLSQRTEDVPALAAQFLAVFAEEQGVTPIGFTAEARRWLVEESWTSNVRELRERVRQAQRLAGSGAISIEALMLSSDGDDIPSFKEAKRAFETRYVESLLRRCSGNISRAARLAKKDRKDFYDVIRRTGVDPQDFRS